NGIRAVSAPFEYNLISPFAFGHLTITVILLLSDVNGNEAKISNLILEKDGQDGEIEEEGEQVTEGEQEREGFEQIEDE
ncbi:MAG: hypothetical protein EZS28_035593, partial [Streblomastix strix]